MIQSHKYTMKKKMTCSSSMLLRYEIDTYLPCVARVQLTVEYMAKYLLVAWRTESAAACGRVMVQGNLLPPPKTRQRAEFIIDLP